jgi:hypothetical protein
MVLHHGVRVDAADRAQLVLVQCLGLKLVLMQRFAVRPAHHRTEAAERRPRRGRRDPPERRRSDSLSSQSCQATEELLGLGFAFMMFVYLRFKLAERFMVAHFQLGQGLSDRSHRMHRHRTLSSAIGRDYLEIEFLELDAGPYAARGQSRAAEIAHDRRCADRRAAQNPARLRCQHATRGPPSDWLSRLSATAEDRSRTAEDRRNGPDRRPCEAPPAEYSRKHGRPAYQMWQKRLQCCAVARRERCRNRSTDHRLGFGLAFRHGTHAGQGLGQGFVVRDRPFGGHLSLVLQFELVFALSLPQRAHRTTYQHPSTGTANGCRHEWSGNLRDRA